MLTCTPSTPDVGQPSRPLPVHERAVRQKVDIEAPRLDLLKDVEEIVPEERFAAGNVHARTECEAVQIPTRPLISPAASRGSL